MERIEEVINETKMEIEEKQEEIIELNQMLESGEYDNSVIQYQLNEATEEMIILEKVLKYHNKLDKEEENK